MNTLTRRAWAFRSFSIVLVGVILAVAFSIYAARWQARVVAEERERAQRAAAAEAMKPVCIYLNAQRAVYADSPPVTSTGRALAASTENLYIQFGCNKLPK